MARSLVFLHTRKYFLSFAYYSSVSIILIIATIWWDFFWSRYIYFPFLESVFIFSSSQSLIFFLTRFFISFLLLILGSKLIISSIRNPVDVLININYNHLNRLVSAVVNYSIVTISIIIFSSGLSLLIKSILLLIFIPLISKYFGI
jgi:hypothetical protein